MRDCKETCASDDYNFHVINEGRFSYLCMTTDTYKRRVAFQFLEEVKNEFIKEFPLNTRETGIALSFNAKF